MASRVLNIDLTEGTASDPDLQAGRSETLEDVVIAARAYELWADANKHLDRALKMIVTAVAAEPENRGYRDSLGWVYYRLGQFPEAVVELEKAVR